MKVYVWSVAALMRRDRRRFTAWEGKGGGSPAD